MELSSSVGRPIVIASLLAGPVFVTSCALASLYLKLPKPVVVSGSEFGLFLVLLGPALIAGFLLAFVPVAIGTAALVALGERSPAFRSPGMWSAVGAAIGIGLVTALKLDGPWQEFGFALVVTCAVCALVSHKIALWED